MSRVLPGFAMLGVLALLVLGGVVALLAGAELAPVALWQDVYLRRVVLFTFWQASLSTLISVALALPVARALARRQDFAGRRWLLRLLGLPLVVPSIVAVFGIVAVYGQNGWLNQILAGLGVAPRQYLYGLGGILIAHVFFNLPLAVRLLLPALQAIPAENWRLAAQLGMRSAALWRLLEWPALRQSLAPVAGLVFMLCFTSFAVVLTLGGGPAATTIEVAIYQALRFDFDLVRAGLLALLQLGCCGLIVAVLQLGMRIPVLGEPGPDQARGRPDLAHWPGRLTDALCIVVVLIVTLLPLAAVALAGLTGPLTEVLGDPRLWRALLNSLGTGLAASALAVLGGAALLLASRELRVNRHRRLAADGIELGGSMILVVPPLVLGTGFFIALQPFADVFAWAPLLVVLVNALMGMPYVIRLLGPPMTRITRNHDRLCASLGLHGWDRFRLLEWPLLRAPVGLSLALCAALATGDLGVIALFGSQDFTTLPLLLQQRLAGYQMGQAAVTALLLLGLSLTLFVVLERGVGGGRRE